MAGGILQLLMPLYAVSMKPAMNSAAWFNNHSERQKS